MPFERLREQASPMGMTLFGPLPGAPDYYLFWAGRSSRLRLVIRPFSTDGNSLTVEHPAANGTYETLVEARRAANAFALETTEDEA